MSSGTGPGELTPDGCAVDFYALLTAGPEPRIVHDAVPAGGSILELGCGTGRILRPLAERGHPVLGVDESPAMLAHLGGLPSVCAPIEGLDLGRTFDAVLLASHMVNSLPDLRRAFLATCRRHVDAGGVVVFQQHAPGWFDVAEESDVERDGVRYILRGVQRSRGTVRAVAEYRVGDRTWTQSFTANRIDDLAGDLAAAGLLFDRCLTDDRSWFTARPPSLADLGVVAGQTGPGPASTPRSTEEWGNATASPGFRGGGAGSARTLRWL
jgi:SAM-dependent methyltransferase